MPISTGGGKALFIGTYLPGNGLHLDVKRELIKRVPAGATNLRATELSQISMTPLLNRVARKLPRPAARRRAAADRPRERRALPHDRAARLRRDGGREDVAHVARIGRRRALDVGQRVPVRRARARPRRARAAGAAAALGGAADRRCSLLGVTVVGGLLLAGTRRNVALMPLVMALAAVAVVMVVQRDLAPPAEPLSCPAMRILILGGDGYLGWPTAMRFSARGHDVFVVDNFARRRWHHEHGTDSLTPIGGLADRIDAWREVSGKRDPRLRRQHRGRRVPRPRRRRGAARTRSSTTASSPRRRTR